MKRTAPRLRSLRLRPRRKSSRDEKGQKAVRVKQLAFVKADGERHLEYPKREQTRNDSAGQARGHLDLRDPQQATVEQQLRSKTESECGGRRRDDKRQPVEVKRLREISVQQVMQRAGG